MRFPTLERLSVIPVFPGWLSTTSFCVLVFSATLSPALPVETEISAARTSVVGLPLFFEADYSEAGDPVQFTARGQNYQFLIRPAEAQFALRRFDSVKPTPTAPRGEITRSHTTMSQVVRMEFAGANPQARVRGLQELPGKINYLVGNDPAQWRANVPTYARVQIQDLYPGIDLVYYGNQRQLEYDFAVAPGADPAAITLHFDGTDKLSVNESGELVLSLGDGEARHHRPALYQTVAGARREVSGGYRLKDARTAVFAVGDYDHRLPLIIDPVFDYSTYFGGNNGDFGVAVKVDSNGFVYVAGQTLSTQFQFPLPTNGVVQPTFGGGVFNGDAFVMRLQNNGTNLVYFTYLGGSADDGALDIALDSSGDACVGGWTESTNFPTLHPLPGQGQLHGTNDPTTHLYWPDGFVAELNTNGSALIYSTYLGGNGIDVADGIAVDAAGNTYVTGYTSSTNFPAKNALSGFTNAFVGTVYNAFVAKIAPNGTNLVYSTYLGGNNYDEGQGIAADANGCAYVAGFTGSTNFPVFPTNAFQTSLNLINGLYDAFVAKIGPFGTNLVYSTYLGGSYNDYAFRVATDGSNAFVTGASQSPDFPNTATNVPGLHMGYGPNTPVITFDVFLSKIGPFGTNLVYSTLFGGSGDDVGEDLALDSVGDVFVIGYTLSTDFPTTNVFDFLLANNSGGSDCFVTAFQANTTNLLELLYSGYLGGSSDDFGYGIAVDAESSAYIVGSTISAAFPTTNALESSLDGPSDAFIAKIRLNAPSLAVSAAGANLQLSWPATAPQYSLQTTTDLAPPIIWANVLQAANLSQGVYYVPWVATNGDGFFRLLRQ